jgi:uncharacterized protein (DUF58 family)
MAFQSHLAPAEKSARVIVLLLALAELLVRGGERIGLLGLTRPTASRRAATRIAEALAANIAAKALTESLPPPARVARFSGVVLVSDFLDPPAAIEGRLKAIAGDGISGHMIQVLDPAEETLPYAGRAEFLALEGSDYWIADRVEGLRGAYQARLGAHRDELRAIAGRLGWSFTLHHTDQSAAQPLLGLIQRLTVGHRGTAGVGGNR